MCDAGLVDEQAFDAFLELYRWLTGVEDPSLLDWTGTMRVRPRITDAPVRDARPDAPARNTVVFGPAGERLAHPDRGVDIVVLGDAPAAPALAEARRVARDVVVTWAADGGVAIEWMRTPAARRPEVTIVVHGDAPDGPVPHVPVTGAIEILHAGPGGVPALNRAADAARGGVLVLLGGETRPAAGWLRPLVRTLRDPGVGVVGPVMLAADGTIQEAGGMVFADGSLAAAGRGIAPASPSLTGAVRDVDFVSAGLLATRTGLFRRLGGLDPALDPGLADVDYGLRVRDAGRRVLLQPQSLVAGSERPAGDPAGEAHRRFTRRWATLLAGRPARPATLDLPAWERLLHGT